MKSSLILLALTVAAAAMPIVSDEDPIAQCDAAPNCETYDTPHGKKIRFKTGMEPGSTDYAARFPNSTVNAVIEKRNTQTHVTYGSDTILYGTVNPCDVLHHCLFDYCHESACDSHTCVVQTQVLNYNGPWQYPSSRDIKVTAHGQYDGWTQRDNYVNAVVTAMSIGQSWTGPHHWHYRAGPKGEEEDFEGDQWWGRQSNFISLNKFYNGNLQGYIEAIIEAEEQQNDFCGGFGGVASAVASELWPQASNFFGAISAVCG